MGKKSDKKRKKSDAEKLEKKKGGAKNAKKRKEPSDILRIMKNYLKKRCKGAEIRVITDAKFGVSYTGFETELSELNKLIVSIGLSADKELFVFSARAEAAELPPESYSKLDLKITGKAKYDKDNKMIECTLIMLSADSISEEQLDWALYKVTDDCDFAVYYSKLHTLREDDEYELPMEDEEYEDEHDEAPAPAEADVSGILEHLMSAAAGHSGGSPEHAAAEKAPREPDSAVTDAEERESMSILSRLLSGGLGDSGQECEPASAEPPREDSNADKGKNEDRFVSVSKEDMLEALFGKKGDGAKKPDAPDKAGGPPDDTDTPPDDTDDTDGE